MDNKELLRQFRGLYEELRKRMRSENNRHISLGDLFTDRWDTAEFYGFGKGSSCYDNVLILGDVKVGEHTWIGPNVILDGIGGLEIGSYCSISAGVQIYSHHTVMWAVSMGQEEIETAPTRIGSGVYIGPQTVVEKGVTIGDRAVIGAMSLVKSDIPAGERVWGVPATGSE